jgi:acid phosphatase type 7
MGPLRRARELAQLLLVCFSLATLFPFAASGQQSPSKRSSSASAASQPARTKSSSTFVMVGAGDIAGCSDLSGAEATAELIENIPGTVFAAGDLAYEHGTFEEFEKCYDPTWGKFKARTRPAPGNHEYNGSGANGYFRYWGKQAGDPSKGYYSFDLGDWHIVALNTNCNARGLGGCAERSPEETWLKQDLAGHPNACILAYGHHPLFSSGLLRSHAEHPELTALWRDLHDAHADLILAGHEHAYERFAPQDPEGNADPEHGIREIVVGTGGRSHTPLGFAEPNSEVRDDRTYGVLKLTLSPGKYRWEFVPVVGQSFHDSGEGPCHNQVPQ